LVPNWEGGIYPSASIRVPARTASGQLFSTFYKLGIRVNHKFPFRKMFPEREDRMVTQSDFEVLLERVEWELSNKDRPKGEEKSKYVGRDEEEDIKVFISKSNLGDARE
jgi:hypothetical protein